MRRERIITKNHNVKSMKKHILIRRFLLWLIAAVISCCGLVSCGTLHTYGGIEHDSYYDLDGHRHYRKHYKKHHKKHHKHHKHHHHHHDDDDD